MLTLLALLLATTPGPTPPGTISATIANVDTYVTAAGSNSNPCSVTLPCATPQYALNKIPKFLRHRAILHLAAGSYPGFYVSGFAVDPSAQQTTSGVMVDGALANATLATGSATGTLTSATAGSQDVYATATVTGAGFTTNNLVGHFLNITSGAGAGQIRVILSNTSSVITLQGYFTTTPDNTSVFAIQDSSVNINTCVSLPPSASATVGTATAAIRTQGNSSGTTITLRNLSVSAACTFGIAAADAATTAINRVQFTSTSGTASKISVSGSVYVDTVYSVYPSTTGTHISISSASSVSNATANGGIGSLSTTAGPGGTVQFTLGVNGFTGLSMIGARSGTILTNSFLNANAFGALLSTSFAGNFNSNYLSCTASSTATGLYITSGSVLAGAASHDHITGCATGIIVEGPSQLTMTTLNVGPGTTGIMARFGGLFTHAIDSPSFTTISGNETVLDSVTTGASSTWAGIGASPNCFMSLRYGSRICQD